MNSEHNDNDNALTPQVGSSEGVERFIRASQRALVRLFVVELLET